MQLPNSVVHINLLDCAVKGTVNTHSLRKQWEEVSKALSLLSAKIYGRQPLVCVDIYNVLALSEVVIQASFIEKE